MRTTDMFLSEESRKNPENSVILPEQKNPHGQALSPHVISLWDKKLENLENSKVLFQENIVNLSSEPSSTITHIEEQVENKEMKIDKESKIDENQGDVSFSLHTLPETEEKAPSRETQIAKVKRAMSQFEAISKNSKKRTRSENSGFFRNLKNLI